MKVTKAQLRRIIKEERARILAEAGPAGDKGDTILQQAYTVFDDPIVDEDGGEIYVDTGLPDEDVEAMYRQWIELWPNAMMEEGGLIYTGVMV